MEKAVLKPFLPASNKNQKEENAMEPTSSPNYPEIRKNINALSDNDQVKTGPTEFNELRPIRNNRNGIFDNILGESDDDTLRAFDLYRKKKILTQGMMDIALFSANANELRHVLETFDGQYISSICVVFLSMSIILQILVGMTMLLSIQYNVTNCEQRKMAFTYGNYTIVGIFLITVVNILISAFGKPA